MKRRALFWMGVLIGVAMLVLAGTGEVWAQAMPWEAPLQTLGTSITGPVAGTVFLIAAAFMGITLIFGFNVLTLAIHIIIGGAVLANLEAIAALVGF